MNRNPLYAAHIEQLQQFTAALLQQQGYAGLLIHSGRAAGLFLDDQQLPFYANPHFKHWLPLPRHQHGVLLIRPDAQPRLYYHNPSDYWHLADGTPQGFWTGAFEISEMSAPAQVHEDLGDCSGLAFIGEEAALARSWGVAAINPEPLLHALHWQRAYKSEYELSCLREASRVAVAGHRAAEQAFRQGDSELAIHLAYQAASRQRENELPYGNIIALNQHGAVLHYQHLDRQPPRERHAFLIDAGAEVRGYAADITRTYSARNAAGNGGLFGEMVGALDRVQQRLVAQLKPGLDFVELHQQTHLAIGLILQAFKLVDMSPESQIECGITRAFFPHGLGHLLGLQVHDVAGKVGDAQGTPLPPPPEHPALRLTRPLEAGMVLTIEPGLYFIDALLAELRRSPQQAALDWDLIERLRPCGGIRIEDNLVIHGDRVENLTRDAFAAR